MSSEKFSHRLYDMKRKGIGVIYTLTVPIALTALLFPLRVHGPINNHDEGIWLSLVQGILDGKRLYRDIWFQYGPLLEMHLHLLANFFPLTLKSVRVSVWILNLIGLGCIFACLLKYVREPRIRIAAASFLWLIPSAAFSPALPYSVRYGLPFVSLLLWPQSNSEKSRRRQAFASGAVASFCVFVSQEVGLASVLAGLVFCALPADRKKTFTSFVAGLALVGVIGLAAIHFRYGLKPYLQCLFIDVPQIVAQENLPRPSLNPTVWIARHSGASWLSTVQGAAESLAFYGPVLSYAGLVLATLRMDRKDAHRATLLCLALYGALTSISAWGRTDRWHIYFSLTPCVFLWAYVLELSKHRPSRDLQFLAFLLAGGFLTIPHLWGQIVTEKQRRPLYETLFLARGGHVKVPVGQANAYGLLVDWIEHRTEPHEPILFFPYDGAIYFFSDRPFPGRYPILAEAVRVDQQQEVIEDIDRAQLRWVIVDTENTMFDGVPVKEFLGTLWAGIAERFQPVAQEGPFVFMARRS